MKKRAELGLLDRQEPQLSENFPKEGFNNDLGSMPNVSFGTIWRYMIDAVDSKRQLSTAKPLVKGFNFYKSGNVHSILHLKQSGKHYLKSQVFPSMKKNLIYQCNIVMSSIGVVLKSYCGWLWACSISIHQMVVSLWVAQTLPSKILTMNV